MWLSIDDNASQHVRIMTRTCTRVNNWFDEWQMRIYEVILSIVTLL